MSRAASEKPFEIDQASGNLNDSTTAGLPARNSTGNFSSGTPNSSGANGFGANSIPSDKGQANPGDLAAYEKVRKSLKSLLERKKALERDLENVEDRIYAEETTYLQEATAGNIAKGFEHYTKSSATRRKATLSESDRVFSQSSSSIFDE